MKPYNFIKKIRRSTDSATVGTRVDSGFTMVEIIVVTGLAAGIIGAVIMLMTNFKRGFTKGEESAIILQEAGLLLGRLRNDLINAIPDRKLSSDRWRNTIAYSSNKLSFSIFRDDEGNIDSVEYVYEREKDATGKDAGTIKRIQGKETVKTLVDKHVASLTWSVDNDVFIGNASGCRLIWVSLSMILGGQGKTGIKSQELNISTKIFPTRINRQINGR